MLEISQSDRFHLSAAEGWLELGNIAEAGAELDQISPDMRDHPIALALRWQLCAKACKWGEAAEIAEGLMAREPGEVQHRILRAYAVRRMEGGGLAQAWEILRSAAEEFPEEPTIPFNLACYASQMGRLAEAREWLNTAIARGGPAIQQMAHTDPDLEPLRASLGGA